MAKLVDLTDRIFGDWTVLRLAALKPTRWLCRCGCGAEREVLAMCLLQGCSTGCSCRQYRELGERSRTHGRSRSDDPTYRCWQHMRQRCLNVRSKDYPYYGGRGVKICERWTEFENFIADMGERPSAGMSIDRINNDGDYEPGNCRWATKNQQLANKCGNFQNGHHSSSRGENHWCAKLTEAQATAIRQRRGEKSQQALAAEYGVAQSLISAIHRGQIWKAAQH